MQRNGEIELFHVSTKDMLADMLTKPLYSPTTSRLVQEFQFGLVLKTAATKVDDV